MKNIVIFASGNGSNAENIAHYFHKHDNVSIQLIVSNKKDAFVLKRAQKLAIEAWVIDKKMLYNSMIVLDRLKTMKIDLIVLAGFLWLIPNNLVECFSNRIINIHPALLPKYGGKGMYGMRVHEAVLANKEKVTGITIHYVNQHYDEGDIIFQQSCLLNPEDTVEDIANKVHQLEYKWFAKVIEKCLFEVDSR
jgi:phosphoribosylglycinamide formyltransferase-1